MPSGLDAVASQALEGLAAAVESKQKRLRIDILTPGLNQKLESSAPSNAGLLLAFLRELLPALDRCTSTKVLFSSAGDAAMAQKTFSDSGWRLQEGVKFASLSPKSVSPEDDAVVIVKPTNSVGDPVILDVEQVVLKAANAVVVLLNPDLGEKVALGIRERDRRTALLSSFEQCYYFRNLFYLTRPGLIPVERGGLVQQWGRGWSVYVTDGAEENMGSGSLNRFMTVPVYRRKGSDPTADRPPTFYLVKQFTEEPVREQLSACIDSATGMAAQAREDAAAAAAVAVSTVEEALQVVAKAVHERGADPAQKVLNAVALLEKDNRSTRKQRKADLDAGGRQTAFEALTQEPSLWQLTFLVKEFKQQQKSSDPAAATGSLSYVPIKAVQEFRSDGTIANGVYAWSFPLVRFTGQFKWSETSSRLTFGFDQCKALGVSVPVPGGQPKVEPGFTMFCVQGGSSGYVLGRGNTGGIALWRRVPSI